MCDDVAKTVRNEFMKAILDSLFEQIYFYNLRSEQSEDFAVKTEYTYMSAGLMDAVVLITHAELVDVLSMYDSFVARYKAGKDSHR